MIKVKRYATAFIRYDGTAQEGWQFTEDWWATEYSSLSEAKGCLSDDIEEINSISEDFDCPPGFRYDGDSKQMIYLEIWSVMCEKEHRDDEICIEDGEPIRCHYVAVPQNCPESVRKLIRQQQHCPVVRYKA